MCKYNIGNSVIEIKKIEQKDFSSRMELFRTNDTNATAVYNVKYVEKIERLVDYKCIYSNSQFAVIKQNNRNFFFYAVDGEGYAVLEEEKIGTYNLFLNNSFFKNKIHPYLFPSLLRLEKELIRKKVWFYILHMLQ